MHRKFLRICLRDSSNSITYNLLLQIFGGDRRQPMMHAQIPFRHQLQLRRALGVRTAQQGAACGRIQHDHCGCARRRAAVGFIRSRCEPEGLRLCAAIARCCARTRSITSLCVYFTRTGNYIVLKAKLRFGVVRTFCRCSLSLYAHNRVMCIRNR